MCDTSEEEFAEYLLWEEAARARVAARSVARHASTPGPLRVDRPLEPIPSEA